jgi:hypothetical protein
VPFNYRSRGAIYKTSMMLTLQGLARYDKTEVGATAGGVEDTTVTALGFESVLLAVGEPERIC